MTDLDPRQREVIRRLRRRLATAYFISYTLWGCVAWLFLWGVAVLLLRATADIPTLWMLLGLTGVLPVIGVALVLTQRSTPEEDQLRSIIDQRNACGGLVMASVEADTGAWRERLPDMRPPEVRQRVGRHMLFLALGCLFVGAGMFVPDFETLVDRAQKLEIDDEVGRLKDQIEALEEEEVLDEVAADALEERLTKIENNADGDGPVRTWEALDSMAAELANEASKAAEDAIQEAEALSKAESLAKGMEQDFDSLNGEEMAGAMSALADLMQKAQSESDLLKKAAEGLDLDDADLDGIDPEKLEELLEALKEQKLTAEQLQQLAQMLKDCRMGNMQCMGRLIDAQLIDGALLKALKDCEPGECEGLGEFLAKCEDFDLSECDMAMLFANCGRPGRGGISRGRGDAPMTWQEDSDEAGSMFDAQMLPPGSLAGLKDSQIVAVSSSRPDENSQGGADGQGTALGAAAAGPGMAHTHTVLPRHRGTVERYFDRGGEAP